MRYVPINRHEYIRFLCRSFRRYTKQNMYCVICQPNGNCSIHDANFSGINTAKIGLLGTTTTTTTKKKTARRSRKGERNFWPLFYCFAGGARGAQISYHQEAPGFNRTRKDSAKYQKILQTIAHEFAKSILFCRWLLLAFCSLFYLCQYILAIIAIAYTQYTTASYLQFTAQTVLFFLKSLQICTLRKGWNRFVSVFHFFCVLLL